MCFGINENFNRGNIYRLRPERRRPRPRINLNKIHAMDPQLYEEKETNARKSFVKSKINKLDLDETMKERIFKQIISEFVCYECKKPSFINIQSIQCEKYYIVHRKCVNKVIERENNIDKSICPIVKSA